MNHNAQAPRNMWRIVKSSIPLSRAKGDVLRRDTRPYPKRPDLDRLLRKALDRRLVLVVAPSGYGKTVALRSATSSMGLPVLWVTAGRAEESIAELVRILLEKLSELAGPIEFDEPPLDSSPDECARNFADSAARALPDGAVLVLDAIDLSPIEPQILAFVPQLLEFAPSSFHIALTTTVEPGLKLTHLARTQQMARIGKEHLAFSEQESRELLCSAWGAQVDERVLSEAMRLSVGWPQGVQALIAAFPSPPESPTILRSSDMVNMFSPPKPIDALPEMEGLDRDLLSSLAFFPAFHPDDTDELTGVQGAGERVRAMIETRPHFLKIGRERYVVEPLLRAKLIATAEKEWPADRLKEHRSLVSGILEARGELRQSLGLLLEVDDHQGANRILKTLGARWFLETDPSVFLSFADRLESIRDLEAEGHLACALTAEVQGEYRRSQQHCEHGLDLADRAEIRLPLKSLKAKARACLASDLSTDEEWQETLEDVTAYVGGSWPHVYIAAELLRRGQPRIAEEQLRRASSRSKLLSTDYIRDWLLLSRGELHLVGGRYQTCLAALRKMTGNARQGNTVLAMAGHQLLSRILGLLGDFSAAAPHAQSALDLASLFKADRARLRSLLLLSDLAVWNGEPNRAREWFGEAEEVLRQSQMHGDSCQAVEASRMRLAWSAGATDAALSAADALLKLPPESFFSGLWNRLSACYTLLRADRGVEAQKALRLTLVEAEEIDALHVVANVLLLLGYGVFLSGDSKSAAKYLARFWGITDVHGHRFMPASDPELMLWAERERSARGLAARTRAVTLMAPPGQPVAIAARPRMGAGAASLLVEIETFGPLRVKVSGTCSEGIWKSRLKAKRFFEVLLSNNSQRVTADEAAEFLWPDASPEKIKHSLHNEVSNLRKVFSQIGVQGHIEVRREHSYYRLYCSDQVRVTHREFQTLAEKGLETFRGGDQQAAAPLLEQAMAFHRGMFLEDAQYERYADSLRQYLSGLLTECLHALAQTPAITDEQTISWWQEAIEHDPYDDEAYQGIIETCLQTGQKNKALKYLKLLKKRFVEELELPLPEWAEEAAAGLQGE